MEFFSHNAFKSKICCNVNYIAFYIPYHLIVRLVIIQNIILADNRDNVELLIIICGFNLYAYICSISVIS